MHKTMGLRARAALLCAHRSKIMARKLGSQEALRLESDKFCKWMVIIRINMRSCDRSLRQA